MDQPQNDNQILRGIKAGRFRDFYLIYCRKSTDEPDNQKNSIPYQKAENGRFVTREHLPIAPITLKSFCLEGVIAERHSGFKEDNNVTVMHDGFIRYRIERPKFHRLIQLLGDGSFKGLVCLCWDRLSRNRGDDTVVRKLMKQGVDVRFVFAKYEKTSSGALHMDIDSMFSEHHSRITSEKVTNTIRELRDQGLCTHRAPVGYLNTGNVEQKPLDPIRAPIIKRMFELYAEGNWSLSDMARWANNQGLTMPPMRRPRTREEMLAEEEDDIQIEQVSRPLRPNMVHKILSNPFYSGRTLGSSGDYVPSQSHNALVADDLFAQVQEALKTRNTSIHYTHKIDLPYRGLVKCDGCKRGYTPYVQKEIQYFSSRCQDHCPNPSKNFNLTRLEAKLDPLIRRLSLTEDELRWLDEQSKGDFFRIAEEHRKEQEEKERLAKHLREDVAYLRENKLSLLKSGAYSPETFVEQENSLNKRLAHMSTTNNDWSVTSMHEAVQDLIKLSELLKTLVGYYSFGNSREKEQIVRNIFSELSVFGNTLINKCKRGFQPLQARLIPVCDPKAWLSELLEQRAEVQACLTDTSSLLKANHSDSSN
jgi:site-specific DNA recombinase